MKLATLTISSLVVVLACTAAAQTRQTRVQKETKPVFNTQALSATQADLSAAISSMTSALPIYDGDRVKSIHFAHRALLIIDHQLSGGKSAPRQKPAAHDHVPSKTAHAKYTPSQIASSQAAMNQGLQSLNKAMTDYQSAVAVRTTNKGVTNAANMISQAISEANQAIAIHAH